MNKTLRALMLRPLVVVATVVSLVAGLVLVPQTTVSAKTARLVPSLSKIKNDVPPTYRNGCHIRTKKSTPKVCTYGAKKGKKRILLFGDSHAASWFGAADRIAKGQKARLLNLTKSACASVPTGRSADCRRWQSQSLKRISAGKFGRIDVAIISNKSPAINATPAQTSAWSKGLDRTLRALSKRAKRIIVLRDQPQLPIGKGYASCIKRYASTPHRCGAPASKAVSASIWEAEKKSVAKFSKARAVDLTTRFCSNSFCSPVKGRYLAMRDDHHIGQTYMRKVLFKQLSPQVVAALKGR